MKQFLEAVIELLKGDNLACELPPPAALCQEALVLLYQFIEARAKAHDQLPSEMEKFHNLSLIQQTICFTPLRLCLQVLALDEHIQIRAGAKGELMDRTGQYFNDPEVSLISQANFVGGMILDPDVIAAIWAKIEAEDRVQRAWSLWQQSGYTTPFQPQITVREI